MLKSENGPKRPRTRLPTHNFLNKAKPNDAMTAHFYLQKKINLAKSEDKCKISKIMTKIEKKRNNSAKTDLRGIYRGA